MRSGRVRRSLAWQGQSGKLHRRASDYERGMLGQVALELPPVTRMTDEQIIERTVVETGTVIGSMVLLGVGALIGYLFGKKGK